MNKHSTKVKQFFDRAAASYRQKSSGFRQWYFTKRIELAVLSVGKNVGSTLDIGCGTGNLFTALQEQQLGGTYLGIDYSPAMLKQSKIPQQQRICEDFFAFADKHQQQHDLVFALGFTTYLEESTLDNFYQLLRKLSKSDSKLVISYTNLDAYDYRYRQWINKLFGTLFPSDKSLGRDFSIYATTPVLLEQKLKKHHLKVTRLYWLPPNIPFLSQLLFGLKYLTLTDDMKKWGSVWRGDFIVELGHDD